jgi:hypothetical protein
MIPLNNALNTIILSINCPHLLRAFTIGLSSSLQFNFIPKHDFQVNLSPAIATPSTASKYRREHIKRLKR